MGTNIISIEEALNHAKQVLKEENWERRSYEAAYTERCVSALKKQIPKKPRDMAACRDCDCIVISGDCPTCSAPGDDSYKFCPRCGQALKWPVLKWPEDFGKWEVEMVNFADEDFVKI